ncbi:hypothetical protein OEA41_010035 [Lepraria neglecta]|uniref:Uncharacterized protein n=1 Tax=Lepraria neglecta TaxID=209136 RepID=A0AAD9YVT0_9LECA|nr:hypothetical protein OEA41_010035 [Lepraria neglecta]
MSDQDFFYDEDEYYVDPYNEAEDLAPHTVHSPVWIDYEPDWDTVSVPSDWEYYSDDYWDHDSPKTSSKKRKRTSQDEETAAGTNGVEEGARRKRKKLDSDKRIPKLLLGELSLPCSAVIWKSKSEIFKSFEGPTIIGGSGEKISLLGDWRERFQYKPKPTSSQSKPKAIQRKGSQQALAVVVDNDSPAPDTYHTSMPPPTTLENAQGLPSRNRVPQSPTAQKAQATNGMDGANVSQDELARNLKPSKLLNKATTNERKRKANNQPSSDAIEEPPAKTPPGRPKKQKTANINSQKENQPLATRANGVVSTSKKRQVDDSDDQPLTSRTNGVASARKRKAEASEDELAMPPPKRNGFSKKGGKADTAAAAKEPSTRRSTRRTRG